MRIQYDNSFLLSINVIKILKYNSCMFNRPRVCIILFLVGAICLYFGLDLSIQGPELFHNEAFRYFFILAVGGLVLQVFSILGLATYSKRYYVSLVCIAIDLVLILAYFLLPLLFKSKDLSKPVEVLYLLMMVAEALIMIFFVLGTNDLADDNFNGMPFLTKLIIFAYVFITAVQLIAGVLVLLGVTFDGVPFAGQILGAIDNISDTLLFAKEVSMVIFLISAIIVIKN